MIFRASFAAVALAAMTLGAPVMAAQAQQVSQAQQASQAPRTSQAKQTPRRPAAVTAEQLARESGVILDIPADFEEIPVPETPLYAFEKAWRKKDGSVEIRMAFRPLRRMVIDFSDPHSSAPSPEDMHEMVFTALLGQIAVQGEMPMRNIPREGARKTFNADWASIALFGAEPELNTKHKEGMLLGIHKFKQADVYVLFLYDGPEKARSMLKELVKVVRFSTATPQEVLKAAAEADRKAKEGYLAEGGDQAQCIPPEGAREVRKSGKDLDQSPEK